MESFEPPGDLGDPGCPGDRGSKATMHKDHYVNTETWSTKEISPETAEHLRHGRMYIFADTGVYTGQDADKDKAAVNLHERHRNNTPISIERLIQNHVLWKQQK